VPPKGFLTRRLFKSRWPRTFLWHFRTAGSKLFTMAQKRISGLSLIEPAQEDYESWPCGNALEGGLAGSRLGR
jgi:hypothetical protein